MSRSTETCFCSKCESLTKPRATARRRRASLAAGERLRGIPAAARSKTAGTKTMTAARMATLKTH
eukprot:7635379-Lingulodinium_polyedra.AAC.1